MPGSTLKNHSSLDEHSSNNQNTDLSDSELEHKNQAAITLVNKWLSEDSDYDQQNWCTVKQSIEEHRMSERKAFDE